MSRFFMAYMRYCFALFSINRYNNYTLCNNCYICLNYPQKMIPIDRVYQTVLTFANSDVRGNLKPKDIRLLINDAVNEIYEEYLLDVNRYVNRENRGLINSGLENMADRVREKILHFLKEETAVYDRPNFTLPEDLRYFDSVWYNSVEVETTKSTKEFKLVKGQANLTREYPIYLKMGNVIKVAPETIVNNIIVAYLRKPLVANWTYNVISDAEVFNPDADDFQDIDLHPAEESNLVLRTCLKAGINLKEDDLIKIANNEEIRKSNTENNS